MVIRRKVTSEMWWYRVLSCRCSPMFFFFNDTATTEIYTLSLHDALPISVTGGRRDSLANIRSRANPRSFRQRKDRKSTRLNSSHSQISYAVFCLKKKNTTTHHLPPSQIEPCSS